MPISAILPASAHSVDGPSYGGGAARPPSITKDDLVQMRDHAAQTGAPAPAGLDKLIAGFDKVAGEGGKMTHAQFRSYAADQGVTLPSAGSAGAEKKAGRAAPAGGPPPTKPMGGARPQATSTSQTKDVTTETAAELAAAAAKGDAKAIQEIARRAAVKEKSAHLEASSLVDALDAERFAPSAS